MTKYFEEIEDTRQPWKIKYNLVEVIVMIIAAVTSAAEHCNEIVSVYGKTICGSRDDNRSVIHMVSA